MEAALHQPARLAWQGRTIRRLEARHVPPVLPEATAVLGSRSARIARQGRAIRLREARHVRPVLLAATAVLGSRNARHAPLEAINHCPGKLPARHVPLEATNPSSGKVPARLAPLVRTAPLLGCPQLLRANRATTARSAPPPSKSVLRAFTAKTPRLNPLVPKTRTAPPPSRLRRRSAAPAPPADNPAQDRSSVLRLAFPALLTSRP